MIANWLLLFVLFVASASASPWGDHSRKLNKGDEEILMTTAEIIVNRGYPVERHFITTEDGYILEAQRIPYGRQSGPAPNKPAVYLQHGFISSSSDWIIGPTDAALAYLLADAGYDVWLGAVRGNTYGRNHTTLSPDDDAREFWDFSFDQSGLYDVPDQIDYVLRVTGHETLSYVGHSQGTLTFFVAMEVRPELNEKINFMFALAPVTRLANMRSPIRLLAPYADDLETIFALLGHYELVPSSEFFDLIGQEACRNDTAIPPEVCESLLFLLCGPDVSELDPDMLPLILSHSPAGTSVRNAVHYAQEYNSGLYIHYDYGTVGNMGHYGQSTPPLYDATKVLTPVITFWGDNDWLADPRDVAWLEPQLADLRESVHIPHFNHLDFLWAIHVKEYVNDIILANLPIKPSS